MVFASKTHLLGASFAQNSSSSFPGFRGPGGVGSGIASYSTTPEVDPTKRSSTSNINSISAMPCFDGKCHEELRIEDYYESSNKGRAAFSFGNQGTSVSDSSAKSPFGSNGSVFGGGFSSSNQTATDTGVASSSRFGVVSVPTFGAPSTTSLSATTPGFGVPSTSGPQSTSNIFAVPSTSSHFQTTPGFGVPSTSGPQSTSNIFAVPSTSSLFQMTPGFGVPSTSGPQSTSNIFGVPSTSSLFQTTSGFGVPSTSGSQSTSKTFGVPNTYGPQSKSNVFGVPSTSSMSQASTSGPFQVPRFGVSSPASLWSSSASVSSSTTSGPQTAGFQGPPAFGGGFGSFGKEKRGSAIASYSKTPEVDPNNRSTLKINSISAMPCFSGKSHEELRNEDYESGNKRAATISFQNQGTSVSDSSAKSPFVNNGSVYGGVSSSSNQAATDTRSSGFIFGVANGPTFGAPSTSSIFQTTPGFGFSSAAAPSLWSSSSSLSRSTTSGPQSTSNIFDVPPSTSSSFQTSRTAPFPVSTTPGFGINPAPSFWSNSASGSSTTSCPQSTSSTGFGKFLFKSNPSNPFDIPRPTTTTTISSTYANPFFPKSLPFGPAVLPSQNLYVSATPPFNVSMPASNCQWNAIMTTSTTNTSVSTCPSSNPSSTFSPSIQFNPATTFGPPSSIPNMSQTAGRGFPLFPTNVCQPSQASSGWTTVADVGSQNISGQQNVSTTTVRMQPSLVANPFPTRSAADIAVGQLDAVSLIQLGISGLAISSSRPSGTRTSLMRLRHVSPRHKKMPAQRHDYQNSTPKVPFFFNKEECPCLVAPVLPRENPRACFANSISGQDRTTLPTYKDRGTNTSIQKEESSVDKKHDDDHVLAVMPNLPDGDYYTVPSLQELTANERAEPGYLSHVNNFVVGRQGCGSVKFLGDTDVRGLDVASIVKFKNREVIVFVDDRNKPAIGQSLNKPAEVTLLNVKCISKETGKQYIDGRQVDRYKEILIKIGEQQGAEFVSYDPVRGEWKFRVQHF